MATTHNVKIEKKAFVMKDINVSKGDTVMWKNYDQIRHTVTADNGEFDSGDLFENDTFEHTFETETGKIGYHCEPHPEMTGSVTVKQR